MNENVSIPRKSQVRQLTLEEIELWLAVTESVVPRPGSRRPQRPDRNEAGPPELPAGAKRAVAGAAGAQDAGPLRRAPALAPLERRLRQRLARGHAAPDAAIDLHGMRSEEAFIALRRFLTRAQAGGAKVALVVTGKGERYGPDGSAGVLRRNVPHWLRSPDYYHIVLGFEEAARVHGGSGALYVRLRRRGRSSGGCPL